MKTMKVLAIIGLCAALGAPQAGAALMGISPPVTSPYYADFNVNNLTIDDSVSGSTATMSITGTASDHYTSSVDSPGTHGVQQGSGGNFNGTFSLNATFTESGSSWSLTGGSFTIDQATGTLLFSGVGAGTVLLEGNLIPGAAGPQGTFGFGINSFSKAEFDFLYTVNTTQNVPANGNNIILQDWATVNPIGTTVKGAMDLQWGSYPSWTGTSLPNWTDGLAPDDGQGDVFIPEPSAYPRFAVGVAALAAIWARRSPARKSVTAK